MHAHKQHSLSLSQHQLIYSSRELPLSLLYVRHSFNLRLLRGKERRDTRISVNQIYRTCFAIWTHSRGFRSLDCYTRSNFSVSSREWEEEGGFAVCLLHFFCHPRASSSRYIYVSSIFSGAYPKCRVCANAGLVVYWYYDFLFLWSLSWDLVTFSRSKIIFCKIILDFWTGNLGIRSELYVNVLLKCKLCSPFVNATEIVCSALRWEN